ncbi:amidase family protein [Nocardia harenae]|uniref:amidase family protein n=1 Tax=Nocardia harenae TaxID=358707 RepID=UPI00082C2297|nr:amidase family protein [Nocardia harenae]
MGDGSRRAQHASTQYLQFSRDRAVYQRAYNRVFTENGLTAIVLPATATDGMPRVAASAASILGADKVPVTWANFSGAPVIALPAGRSAAIGMPFGLQLGRVPWAEVELLEMRLALEAAAPHWAEVPPMARSPLRIPELSFVAPGQGPRPHQYRRGHRRRLARHRTAAALRLRHHLAQRPHPRPRAHPPDLRRLDRT